MGRCGESEASLSHGWNIHGHNAGETNINLVKEGIKMVCTSTVLYPEDARIDCLLIPRLMVPGWCHIGNQAIELMNGLIKYDAARMH